MGQLALVWGLVTLVLVGLTLVVLVLDVPEGEDAAADTAVRSRKSPSTRRESFIVVNPMPWS